jgi:AcrR family transcriptional regulator
LGQLAAVCGPSILMPSIARETTASTGLPRLPRAERKALILAAATSAFAVGGYTATSMADISRMAGVTHLIVYTHFESKENLYDAVLRSARTNLEKVLMAPGSIGKFGPTTATVLAAARAGEDAFRVLWWHAPREPAFSSHADAARNRLEAVTREALGTIGHVEWAARATVSYVVQAVLVWVEDGDERLDHRFVMATEAALRAGVRSWSKSG